MAEKREVARITDESLWDSFVGSSPQGSVFSTSGYLCASAEAQGGEPVILGVFENGRIAGGAAFLEVKRGPFRKATTPALAPYGGFLFAPFAGTRPMEAEHHRAVCTEALICYLLRRYQHISLLHDPRVDDVREFLWSGFSCPVRYTYVVDISDPDSLWAGLERKVRRVIGHAESTVSIEETIDVALFGALYEQLYRDRGVHAPVSRKVVEALTGRAIADGIAEMRLARDVDGEAAAAMLFVFDRQSVYTLASGAIPSRNSSGAATMLYWDAMKRHAGLRGRFDFAGANIRSIAFFKRGFGGRLTPYFATERYSSPLVRAAFTAYAGIHKAFS